MSASRGVDGLPYVTYNGQNFLAPDNVTDGVSSSRGHIDTPESQAAADKTIEVLQKPAYKAQLDARLNALRQLYEREGKPYTEQMLLNDIAVDMRRGGLLYRTSADYDRATRTDNYDRDRFIPNTVRRATSTVKSVFGGTVTNENAGITVSAKDANTIREAWERADNASAGAHRAGTATENEGDVKYSIQANSGQYDYTKPFSQQVDDYKNGVIPQRDSLIVRDTPKVFRDVGFNPLPFTINQTHVDYALNGSKDIDHAIGEAMLKQLPESLDNPVAIIKSKLEDSNRVVALLDFVHNGKNVVTPVEIDGYGRQNNIIIDSNAITSIYGKNNLATGLLSDALNEEQSGNTAVFYLDNKKATALLQKAGLQLPRVLFRNDGYIHSIREQGSDVKPKFENVTYTQQFKEYLSRRRAWKQRHTPAAAKYTAKP